MTVVRNEMVSMLSQEVVALYEPVWRASQDGSKELITDLSRISLEWSHDFMLFNRRDYLVETWG